MVAIINYKRCDRAQACPCISVCPSNALYYDIERERPIIDKSKCNNCGACVKRCPAQIIQLAMNEQEEQRILDEIAKDEMSTAKLFEERYGVPPGNTDFIVNKSNFEEDILNSKAIVLVDCWSFKYAPCRVKAISFNDLIKGARIRKLDVDKNKDLAKQFSVSLFPTLLVFKDGDLVDRFEGQVSKEKLADFKKWLNLYI